MSAAPASLAAFVAASALVIVVPGPATLFVLDQARASRRRAALAVLGLAAGDLLAITAAGLGLAALLHEWPAWVAALRLVGAVYVGWLGLGMLRPVAATAVAPASGCGSFVPALWLTLVNPKPLLFFGTFFPLFIAAGRSPWLVEFWRLGLVFELINLGYFAALIALFAALRRRLPTGAGTAFRRLGGLGLIGCALLVLLG